MKTKIILPIAIISMLPFAANATDPVGPAAVPSNGTAVVATAGAPYQTVTIDANDGGNIASVKYVKGAYNDAIAAVNKVNDDKQDKLIFVDGGEVDMVYGADAGAGMMDEYISANTVGGAQVGQAALESFENHLLSASGVIGAIGTAVDSQRVLIYTTWDDDTKKIGVPLANYIGVQNDIY